MFGDKATRKMYGVSQKDIDRNYTGGFGEKLLIETGRIFVSAINLIKRAKLL